MALFVGLALSASAQTEPGMNVVFESPDMEAQFQQQIENNTEPAVLPDAMIQDGTMVVMDPEMVRIQMENDSMMMGHEGHDMGSAEPFDGGEAAVVGGIFGFFAIIWLGAMGIALLGFIFWVMMLVRAIKYDSEHKVLWILVIVLGNLIGAIVYYFVEGRDVKKRALAQEQAQTTAWQNPAPAQASTSTPVTAEVVSETPAPSTNTENTTETL